MLVATVGSIMSGKLANDLLEKGLDVGAAGRMFQKNPGLVWAWAEEIGVEINLPNQIRWGFGGAPGVQRQEEVKSCMRACTSGRMKKTPLPSIKQPSNRS